MPGSSYLDVFPQNQVIVLDTGSLDGNTPITAYASVKLSNKSPDTFYYKINISSPVWSMNEVTGSVGGGSTKYEDLIMTRSATGGTKEFTETITVTISIYADSGYTQLLDTISHGLTVIGTDLTDITQYTIQKDDFDSGSVQGWSGNYTVTTNGTYTIDPNGQSLKIESPHSWSRTYALSKTYATIPTGTKVYFGAFFTAYTGYHSGYIQAVVIKVNGETVFYVSGLNIDVNPAQGWFEVVADITAYAGQSNVTIEINVTLNQNTSSSYTSCIWLDHPFIAYK